MTVTNVTESKLPTIFKDKSNYLRNTIQCVSIFKTETQLIFSRKILLLGLTGLQVNFQLSGVAGIEFLKYTDSGKDWSLEINLAYKIIS